MPDSDPEPSSSLEIEPYQTQFVPQEDDEETLWDRIDQMEDWWKESTWTRLIQRELPDL